MKYIVRAVLAGLCITIAAVAAARAEQLWQPVGLGGWAACSPWPFRLWIRSR